MNPSEPDLESCHNLLLNINQELVSIDNNHNIHFICEKELSRRTTLNGNLEEVLDTSWVELDGQIFVVAATNSPILQLRGIESGHSKASFQIDAMSFGISLADDIKAHSDWPKELSS